MTYKCDPCQGKRPVARIYTSLTDGSTDAACIEDEPIMLIGHLAIALDLDPQRLYDVVQRFSEREVKREQKLLEAAQATAVVEGQQPSAGQTDQQAIDAAIHQDYADGLDDDDLGRAE